MKVKIRGRSTYQENVETALLMINVISHTAAHGIEVREPFGSELEGLAGLPVGCSIEHALLCRDVAVERILEAVHVVSDPSSYEVEAERTRWPTG